MALIGAKSKYYFYNTMVCLLKAMEGKVVTVELRGGVSVRGRLEWCESNMRLELSGVLWVDVLGNKKTYDRFYVKGRQLYYVHIPDEIDIVAAMHYQLEKGKYLQGKDAKKRQQQYEWKERRKFKRHKKWLAEQGRGRGRGQPSVGQGTGRGGRAFSRSPSVELNRDGRSFSRSPSVEMNHEARAFPRSSSVEINRRSRAFSRSPSVEVKGIKKHGDSLKQRSSGTETSSYRRGGPPSTSMVYRKGRDETAYSSHSSKGGMDKEIYSGSSQSHRTLSENRSERRNKDAHNDPQAVERSYSLSKRDPRSDAYKSRQRDKEKERSAAYIKDDVIPHGSHHKRETKEKPSCSHVYKNSPNEIIKTERKDSPTFKREIPEPELEEGEISSERHYQRGKPDHVKKEKLSKSDDRHYRHKTDAHNQNYESDTRLSRHDGSRSRDSRDDLGHHRYQDQSLGRSSSDRYKDGHRNSKRSKSRHDHDRRSQNPDREETNSEPFDLRAKLKRRKDNQ